jgi:hypothetical protein
MRTGEMLVAVSGKGRKRDKELICPPLKDSKNISFSGFQLLECNPCVTEASDRKMIFI